MTDERRMRGTMLIGDGWRDSDLYAILEQEWSGQPSTGRDGFSDRHGRFGPSAAFDRDREVVVLVLDQLHRGVESSDANDAIPVR
jgi:hypothetical protein